MKSKIKALRDELEAKENMCKAVIFEQGYSERNETLQVAYHAIVSRLDDILKEEESVAVKCDCCKSEEVVSKPITYDCIECGATWQKECSHYHKQI